MRSARAIVALVLVALGGLAALTLGVPWGSSTGSASPSASLACAVKTSCGPGEVAVFRMSSTANAHAGTPGGSSYGSIVCCGGVRNLSTSCSAVYDGAVTLSGADNAHVAADGSFAAQACLSVPYGVADCTYGPSCGTDYTCLATVSGSSNAHMADCDGAGDYATKVCCYVEDDNDNDGLLDPPDLDDDNDGLADQVDVSQFTVSTAFSDQALGGTTFGILSRNGLTAEAREEPNPAGVRIAASGSGGPATVDICGIATLDLTSGDDMVVTCGSATIQVLSGPIEVAFCPFRATLPTGTITTISEWASCASEVTNSSESAGPIIVNGIQIPPGHTERDDDADAFFTSVEQYLGTDHLDACPDGPSDDAWPLDIDRDGAVSGTGDAFNYVGRIGATPVSPNWWQRLDLDMDSAISVTGDVFMYVGRVGETCR